MPGVHIDTDDNYLEMSEYESLEKLAAYLW